MKTTLTILVAGLIFVMVPVMASAHGDHDRDRHGSYKVYVEKDHHHQHKNWKKRPSANTIRRSPSSASCARPDAICVRPSGN